MPKTIKKTLIFTILVVVLMFGFSFALAPLYTTFCRVTGLNTAQRINPLPDSSREITIQFISTNNQELPWEFFPRTRIIKVHPDENTQIFFHAKNTTNTDMIVQAIPSFTPPIAVKYFNKIECFCFRQQKLKAGESREMPVVFRVDKKIPADINTITLSYTLFKAPSSRKTS